ncbi:hypothetical protein EVAR_95653_1 [Eumeta japonica]|uniref:Uncharacterized protein n=1 Tax=Eumeta variegata TaxID=151549 RepID=A0A4C1VM14_EUMVA|nr:hypothetical protein EVAR_95653_1 [Eumeta japonica]
MPIYNVIISELAFARSSTRVDIEPILKSFVAGSIMILTSVPLSSQSFKSYRQWDWNQRADPSALASNKIAQFRIRKSCLPPASFKLELVLVAESELKLVRTVESRKGSESESKAGPEPILRTGQESKMSVKTGSKSRVR